MNHKYIIAGLYVLMIFVTAAKQCTTNDVCMLLCLNMAVTYIFKKDSKNG